MRIKVKDDGSYEVIVEYDRYKGNTTSSGYYASVDSDLLDSIRNLVNVRGQHMLLDQLYDYLHTKYGVSCIKDGLDCMTPRELIDYLKNASVDVPLATIYEKAAFYWSRDYNSGNYTGTWSPNTKDTTPVSFTSQYGPIMYTIFSVLNRLESYIGNVPLREATDYAKKIYPTIALLPRQHMTISKEGN